MLEPRSVCWNLAAHLAQFKPGTVSNRNSFLLGISPESAVSGEAVSNQFLIRDLNAKSDKIALRVMALNAEMLRQPLEERRANWRQYYRRLAELMKLQHEVAQAITALNLDQ